MKNKGRRNRQKGPIQKPDEIMLPQTISPTELIATKIRILRRNREYSQEYMALMLHISQNAYSRLENGKTPITLDRYYEVCQILQIKPSELLDMVEMPKPKAVWRRSSY
jgi:transcriptional regulator with XRE-family HTH domain